MAARLALQLRFLFLLHALDVSEARFGLVGSAPEQPGDLLPAKWIVLR